MIINICHNAFDLGMNAAKFTGYKLNEFIKHNGEARMVIATGNSQFEILQSLLKEEVDWKKVEIFHLDEYIGLPIDHKASFRKYLYERFIDKISIKKFHSIDVNGDIAEKIHELTFEIRKRPVDIGLIGIGVNGHIAFNDPPADFNTRESYIIVNLDHQCRLQQVNEGWFESIYEVPAKAVSMTPWQIMQCRTIISCVPHKVKALAVRNTLTNNVTEKIPATILKQHSDFNLYLDKDSASEIILL